METWQELTLFTFIRYTYLLPNFGNRQTKKVLENLSGDLNPLLPESFFCYVIFGTLPKIGSYRLPTHSEDTYRNYFNDPFLIKLKLKFGSISPLCFPAYIFLYIL